MTCNIDSKGRSFRLITGMIFLIAGGVFIAIALFAWPSWIPWLIAACCIAGGSFSIYEALAGWCALRAMGMRTPL